MERLGFGYYQDIFYDIESYESHFFQLERDYKRELNNEKLIFAVDFSEIYTYIHFAKKGSSRSDINIYILDTLKDQFTLLPGAVGELFSDLEKLVPEDKKNNLEKFLHQHPEVNEFLYNFNSALPDENNVIRLYTKAEPDFRGALEELITTYLSVGNFHTSLSMLKNLVDNGKLIPIEGVENIGPVSDDAKRLLNLVESHLSVSRPTLTESNQIDAIDFLVALLLNQQSSRLGREYITIYSQAENLIEACRSHNSLQWDNDFLIRELKYLQYRTKLQELYPDLNQRYQQVKKWRQFCQKQKEEISKLIDVDEQLHEDSIEPALAVVDGFRRFTEEIKEPLTFTIDNKVAINLRAQALYSTLVNEKKYEGTSDEAFYVLKEHIRQIHKEFQSFTPLSTDSSEAATYKANLLSWLKDIK